MLYALIPNIVLIHLSASPYTKVEESFHIQATHDILTFGIPSPLQLNSTAIRQYFQSNYDHFTFPGAVPRTFIGALGLATTSWPIARFYENVDKQILGESEITISSIGLFLKLIISLHNISPCCTWPVQCSVFDHVCAGHTKVFWQHCCSLVPATPGQSVPYCLLCISDSIEHVCIWY